MDGNLLKRVASGGDEIELRTNHRDEVRKRLQSTFFLHCNDFPPVEPADAYKTLEVFQFHCSFHPACEIQARGGTCPKHWRVADPNIKHTWVRQPAVLDAFTKMVLEAWKPDLLAPPTCVTEHTMHFNGPASVAEIDRFAEVVKYDPSTVKTRVFVEEIKLALENAGLRGMSSYKITTFVQKLYGDETAPPAYHQFRKEGKRAYGFDHLRIKEVVAFDGSEERRSANLARAERVRQQVRNGEGELGKRMFDDMDE